MSTNKLQQKKPIVSVQPSAAKQELSHTAQAVTREADYNEVYQKEYGWIAKGDIDASLKCVLKELVRARLERSKNNV